MAREVLRALHSAYLIYRRLRDKSNLCVNPLINLVRLFDLICPMKSALLVCEPQRIQKIARIPMEGDT